MMAEKHARAFDLPGWPCPPRVRDIPDHKDSWGWVPVSQYDVPPALAADDLGFLWVNGDVTPRFQLADEDNQNPGAILFWTPDGIGLWVHPKSLRHLPSISRLDMQVDQWVKVAVVAAELPDHIR